jgi:hypothetical protein
MSWWSNLLSSFTAGHLLCGMDPASPCTSGGVMSWWFNLLVPSQQAICCAAWIQLGPAQVAVL